MELQSEITDIKGIGEHTAKLFARLGVRTVNDLLHYFPKNYVMFPHKKTIAELKDRESCVISGYIIGTPRMFRKGSKTVLSFQVTDRTGEVTLTYFNMPYLKKQIMAGKQVLVHGICRIGEHGRKRLEQPKMLKAEEYEEWKDTLQPVYGLTEGLTNKKISKAVSAVLSCAEMIQEYLPADIVREEGLSSIEKAVRQMHFPETMESVYEARKRLAFDEFFLFQMRIRELRKNKQKHMSCNRMKDGGSCDALEAKLPFALTVGQKQAVEEIKKDLCSGYQMNRLVQGDVGCGKTIVAWMAVLMTVSNGYQAAMMAPTEVLAAQHYQDILHMTEEYDLPIRPVLLTGSITSKEKKMIREGISSGEYDLVIGTHALIQETVVYHNLALVITDEQHRFGVRQRSTLMGKGMEVHVLVMSATPIPRTLGLVLYGDLDVTVIRELPAQRLPIKNAVVDTSYREKAYAFLLKQIAEGRQAYIICPMVEEGEMEDLVNVTDYSEELKERFAGAARVAMLHGKMKPKEKDAVMTAFKEHQTDLLISTTVVEVGVNVPNATVIMVENAERFGLAQLHQLRGRVGRGDQQSYCMFVVGNDSKKAKERLAILAKTNDGFQIAEEDLKQRGPGDFFGLRQAGILQFQVADIFTDAVILKRSKEVIERIEQENVEEFEKLYEIFLKQEEMSFIDLHAVCL
ncbi:MAG: ATP-dependent DNA helicase RecG [Lachnospiraceae bacterium]|nr:ATP-dependent DNA helicase RecG [Lachnospiraceae bacterium]